MWVDAYETRDFLSILPLRLLGRFFTLLIPFVFLLGLPFVPERVLGFGPVFRLGLAKVTTSRLWVSKVQQGICCCHCCWEIYCLLKQFFLFKHALNVKHQRIELFHILLFLSLSAFIFLKASIVTQAMLQGKNSCFSSFFNTSNVEVLGLSTLASSSILVHHHNLSSPAKYVEVMVTLSSSGTRAA